MSPALDCVVCASTKPRVAGEGSAVEGGRVVGRAQRQARAGAEQRLACAWMREAFVASAEHAEFGGRRASAARRKRTYDMRAGVD